MKLAAVILFLTYTDYGFQFLYQMIAARILAVEDYGIYSALASLGTAFILFSGVFPVLTLRNVSHVATHHPQQVWPCILKTLKLLSYAVLPYAAVLIIASPRIAKFYHLESAWPVVVAISVFVLGCYLNTLVATLQSIQLYVHGTALNFTFTLMRMSFGVAFIYVWQARFVGMFYGLFVAHVIVLLAAAWFLVKKVPWPKVYRPYAFNFEGWQTAILISVGMGTLMGLDTSLARHFLSAEEAGLYSAASVTAKIVFMLSTPFMNWIIPETTRSQAKSDNAFSPSRLLMLTAGIAGLGWCVVSLFPGLIISILVGSKYIEAQKIVPILASASLLLACVAVMNHYSFVLKIRSYFICLYSTAFLGLASIVLVLNTSMTALAIGILLGPLLTVTSGLWVLHRARVKARAQSTQVQ